jgi:hypothetical protein
MWSTHSSTLSLSTLSLLVTTGLSYATISSVLGSLIPLFMTLVDIMDSSNQDSGAMIGIPFYHEHGAI